MKSMFIFKLVVHGHFTVDGAKVDIPSYLVKSGMTIAIKESSRSSVAFKRLTAEDAPLVTVPQWLERDKNALKGTVDGEKLTAAMDALGLKPTARAEELTVESWIALSNACAE